MALVPHHAYITRTLRRLFPFACCFVFLSLLVRDKMQEEVGLDGSGRRRIDKKQETVQKPVSQLFSANWPERNVTASSLKSSPIPMKTFTSQDENMTLFVSHPENIQEVLPLWMRITDDLYTYSAFWDARKGLPMGATVRVLGILRYQKELLTDVSKYWWSGEIRSNALNYTCFLWYTGQDAVKGQLSAFIYEEGLKVFVGTYFFCSPSNISNPRPSDSTVPYAVSLVPYGGNHTSPKLIYLTPKKTIGQSNQKRSAVCVRPLFGPYADLGAIALFISYYSTVLNVSHFHFYDFAISKKVREFLNLLMAEGEVSIHLLPWNIPFSEWETLWDLGSLTSLNDCVYRTSGRHNHVAIVDLDEFIVPRTPVTSLGQLYNAVIKHKHGQEGDSVLILNTFFCSEFQEQNETSSSDDFSVFRATFREARLWPSKSRTKIIVMPEAVVAVGHHMVHQFLKSASKNHSSPKLLAVLHHYRNCDGLRFGIHAKGSEVLHQKPTRDNAIVKYKKKVLASRTISQYLHFIKNT